MGTLREEAYVVAKILNGGKVATDDNSYSIPLIMQVLVKVRDLLMERDIANESVYDPDEEYYTVYDSETDAILKWDERREYPYVDLPGGNPPKVPYCGGIKIESVTGGGALFKYSPYGWARMNPDIAFCEGNWTWEHDAANKRVIFTNMRRIDMPGQVVLKVIETKQVRPDKPLAMPARHAATCMDMALERLGMNVKGDVQMDGMDGRRAGQ
jgi:hypothetical protein